MVTEDTGFRPCAVLPACPRCPETPILRGLFAAAVFHSWPAGLHAPRRGADPWTSQVYSGTRIRVQSLPKNSQSPEQGDTLPPRHHAHQPLCCVALGAGESEHKHTFDVSLSLPDLQYFLHLDNGLLPYLQLSFHSLLYQDPWMIRSNRGQDLCVKTKNKAGLRVFSDLNHVAT